MEKFKEVFTRLATKYAEYVEEKITSQTKCGQAPTEESIDCIDRTQPAYLLMNEVRTVNVIAVTLTRMNTKEVGELVIHNAN